MEERGGAGTTQVTTIVGNGWIGWISFGIWSLACAAGGYTLSFATPILRDLVTDRLRRRLGQRDKRIAVAGELAYELMAFDNQLAAALIPLSRITPETKNEPLWDALIASLPKPSSRLVQILEREDTGLPLPDTQALKPIVQMVGSVSEGGALALKMGTSLTAGGLYASTRPILDQLRGTRKAIRHTLGALLSLVDASISNRISFHQTSSERANKLLQLDGPSP